MSTRLLSPAHIGFSCTPSTSRDDEAHLERAAELIELGNTRHAERIIACAAPPLPRRRCGLTKACPTCSAEKAERNARRAREAIRGFARPVFLTLTLPTLGPWTLDAGLTAFILKFGALRRKAAWRRMVLGGVAGIEPHLSRRRALWAVHAHAIVDAASAFDLGLVRELWEALTGDRGLVLEADGGLDVVAPHEAAKYITKPDDWCPRPRALPAKALELLGVANHRRHVFLRWGTARRAV